MKKSNDVPKKINIPYDKEKKYEINPLNFFTNKNEKYCPINKCRLLELGCEQEYKGKNLGMKGLKINADQDYANGYISMFCLECSNEK